MFNWPKDNDKLRCRHCKWEGERKDALKREVNTPRSAWEALAGREGYEWDCPRCKWIVDSFYTKMS